MASRVGRVGCQSPPASPEGGSKQDRRAAEPRLKPWEPRHSREHPRACAPLIRF